MIIFTSICANYLHKARTLADSIKEQMPDVTFIVCIVEKELKPSFEYCKFDKVILAKEAWEGNFERFIYKHSIVEASTAIKGQFFRYLYKAYSKENAFVYLDPDIFVYGDFVELKERMKTRPIILCPHLLEPGNIDMELSSTAHGVYNLGFLAVNNSDEAKRFINWWAERLCLFCYDDIPNGIFTDQKWIDLAPCFFDVEILKHHGYDFATWSLLNCDITNQGEKYYVHDEPLRFVHFSGYGTVLNNCIKNWLPEGPHPFKTLYEDYSIRHEMNDADGISKSAWSYGVYSSGEKIDDELRKLYRKNYDAMLSIGNPFLLSNSKIKSVLNKHKHHFQIGTLYAYCKRASEILKQDGLVMLGKKVLQKIRQIKRKH